MDRYARNLADMIVVAASSGRKEEELFSFPLNQLLFEVLENQKLIDGEARITLVPHGSDLLAQMLAASAKAQRPETPADVSRRDRE